MKIEADPTDTLLDVTVRPHPLIVEGPGSQPEAVQEATP